VCCLDLHVVLSKHRWATVGQKSMLITALFPSYLEPRSPVSRHTTGGTGSGKPDYRHRARTDCVEKREVAHRCFCDPHMQVKQGLVGFTQRRISTFRPPTVSQPAYIAHESRVRAGSLSLAQKKCFNSCNTSGSFE